LLFYYEQLSLKEIAARLNISVVAVKGRLYKSRQRLRLKLLAFYQVEQILERRRKMIKVTVADVVKQGEEIEKSFVAVLLDEAGQRLLPIWIGPSEGYSIATNLLGHSRPRPLTYTFMANLLKAAGAELEAVWVGALKDTTYYATARIRMGDSVREVDARPSDAINLALCTASPIYVAEAVMETASVDISRGRFAQGGWTWPDSARDDRVDTGNRGKAALS
jgi:bifunctional DNase/RNase